MPFHTTFTKARTVMTEFEDEREARAYAQRKANSLKTDVTITYTDHEGRREYVTCIMPEKKPRTLAIYRHLDACKAAGMTAEEASHAWRVGDYRC